MAFKDTLAALRNRAGMSQVDLALKAGIRIDTLRRWEQGRNLPRIDDAYKLAQALGVDMDELILGKDMEAAAGGEPGQEPKPKAKGPKRGK